MTDRPDDPRADDQGQHPPDVDADTELASALHDGEAGQDERARAGDPALAEELAQVAAVSGLVADVPPPPSGLVDDHVAAALAAFDAPAGEHAQGPRVVALADRRAWWARAPLVAAAAAIAVVALVGAIGFAAVGDDGSSDDTATAALEERAGGDMADDAAADEPADGDAGGAETFESGASGAGGGPPTAAERETFGTYDELADALRHRSDVAAPEADTDVATTPADAIIAAPAPDEQVRSTAAGCDAIGAAGIDPAEVRLVASVVVADRLVTAVVHGTGDERTLTALDEETCTVTEQRTL